MSMVCTLFACSLSKRISLLRPSLPFGLVGTTLANRPAQRLAPLFFPIAGDGSFNVVQVYLGTRDRETRTRCWSFLPPPFFLRLSWRPEGLTLAQENLPPCYRTGNGKTRPGRRRKVWSGNECEQKWHGNEHASFGSACRKRGLQGKKDYPAL